ncbi:MAG: hypothetical protein IKS04_01985 [Clostridia bacterium]|nr:hypothetical protein [Clostridia bacterium]MBR6701678.1 hypothetical protein [Clostridia bacterium]
MLWRISQTEPVVILSGACGLLPAGSEQRQCNQNNQGDDTEAKQFKPDFCDPTEKPEYSHNNGQKKNCQNNHRFHPFCFSDCIIPVLSIKIYSFRGGYRRFIPLSEKNKAMIFLPGCKILIEARWSCLPSCN